MAVRKRTSLKSDPDRNLQLNDGEIQLEGYGGAVTVMVIPMATDQDRPVPMARIRSMERGYRAHSSSALLDHEQLDAYIDMLIEIRGALTKLGAPPA